MRVTDLTLPALFAAVISVLAQISIPLPLSPVPVTGQMLGVFLAGALLGSRLGTISVLTYVLLGTVGLPVFAQGRGGPAVLLGPSGGYLAGFVLGTFLLGKTVEKGDPPAYGRTAAGMILCLVSTYVLGCTQLAVVLNLTPARAVWVGVLPYLPLDLLKLALATALAVPVRRSLQAAGVLPVLRRRGLGPQQDSRRAQKSARKRDGRGRNTGQSTGPHRGTWLGSQESRRP